MYDLAAMSVSGGSVDKILEDEKMLEYVAESIEMRSNRSGELVQSI